MLKLFLSLLSLLSLSNLFGGYPFNNSAILVLGYNRPDYFEKCLKALERNPESESMPFIFALDGGSGSKQKELTELINNSKIKHKQILKRDYNYGCPKNYIDAQRYAFDTCCFQKLIVIEDDVVVTDSYINFMLNFHSWAERTYANIGVVQGWSLCWLSVEEKAKRIDQVTENSLYWSFVTYCLDKKTWNRIKPLLYTFEKYIDSIPLKYSKERSRPEFSFLHKEIKDWVKHTVKSKKKKYHAGDLISAYNKQHGHAFLSKKFMPNIDHIMGFALYMHDLIKLKTVVNRAIHIGIEGISTNNSIYTRWKYNAMVLDMFPEDSYRKSFKLI